MRARTTALATVAVALALVVAGVALTTGLRRTLLDDLDSSARARAADIAELVRRNSVPRTIRLGGHEDGFVQVVQRGEVVGSTRNLRDQPPVSRAHPPVGRVEWFSMQTVPTGEDDQYRMLSTAVGGDGSDTFVYVGFTVERVEDSVRGCASCSSWSSRCSSSSSPSRPGTWSAGRSARSRPSGARWPTSPPGT